MAMFVWTYNCILNSLMSETFVLSRVENSLKTHSYPLTVDIITSFNHTDVQSAANISGIYHLSTDILHNRLCIFTTTIYRLLDTA